MSWAPSGPAVEIQETGCRGQSGGEGGNCVLGGLDTELRLIQGAYEGIFSPGSHVNPQLPTSERQMWTVSGGGVEGIGKIIISDQSGGTTRSCPEEVYQILKAGAGDSGRQNE